MEEGPAQAAQIYWAEKQTDQQIVAHAHKIHRPGRKLKRVINVVHQRILSSLALVAS